MASTPLRMSQITDGRWAPRATRIPISLRRRETEYVVIPYRPTMASRGCANESLTCVSRVRNSREMAAPRKCRSKDLRAIDATIRQAESYCYPSGCLQYLLNGPVHALVVLHFRAELLASGGRGTVVSSAPVAGRHAPLCRHPPFQ